MTERHNHMTRDIKPMGECPACDVTHGCDCARYAEWVARLNQQPVGHYVSPHCPVHRDENGVPR